MRDYNDAPEAPAYKPDHIRERLNVMEQQDTWGLILFALYKLRDNPEWLTLSEMAYLMDSKDLVRFLKHFEGLTITIPASKDLRLIIQAFTLYRLVDFEGFTMDRALRELDKSEWSKDDIKKAYIQVKEVVRNYDFAAK